MRQVAERYGVHVTHNGMCKCPFHNDKNPSMKIYEKQFHCFGCKANGDVISFTGRLFNIPPKEAAQKLADDFYIPYDNRYPAQRVQRRHMPRDEDVFAHKADYCFHELAAYRNLLVMWRQQYAPKTPDEQWHPLFKEALENLDNVEYQLDILQAGTDEDKLRTVTDYIKEKREQEGRLMEPIINTPVYPESAEYARAHGELEQYRASHHANIDCKRAIEQSVSSHFDGFRLDKNAVSEVMKRYGPERISLVLAATVQVKAWDGRFSSANKDWAFSFDFPDPVNEMGFDRRDNYAVTTHPAVLDGFINLVRQEIQSLERSALDEKKYAVLLTDAQEVKILECDPQEEMFETARGVIGCEWIELVEPDTVIDTGLVMLIDEEGKLRSAPASINCIASDLYGSDRHGDPIVGNALIVHSNDESLELLTNAEAKSLAENLNMLRDQSIEKISEAFSIHPTPEPDRDASGLKRRQPCKKNDMER